MDSSRLGGVFGRRDKMWLFIERSSGKTYCHEGYCLVEFDP